MIGYPMDKYLYQHPQMYEIKGSIIKIEDEIFRHDLDNYKMLSGSAIFEESGDSEENRRYTILGIHSRGWILLEDEQDLGHTAQKIGTDKFIKIKMWFDEFQLQLL